MRRFVIGIAELLNAVFVILTPLGTFTNATQIHSLRPPGRCWRSHLHVPDEPV